LHFLPGQKSAGGKKFLPYERKQPNKIKEKEKKPVKPVVNHLLIMV